MSGTLPADWESVSSSAIARFDADKPKVATRIANRDVLNAIAPHLPELFGGSADLTGSVGTWHEKASRIGRNDWNGNYLSYGVREFVMGSSPTAARSLCSPIMPETPSACPRS